MGERKSTFTRHEAAIIRTLLVELRDAGSQGEQKRIRDKLRAMGFYISEFSASKKGFTEAAFIKLVEDGTVTVLTSPNT